MIKHFYSWSSDFRKIVIWLLYQTQVYFNVNIVFDCIQKDFYDIGALMSA